MQYDGICNGKSTWQIEFIPSDSIDDALLFYRLDNFYSNHKNFVKSRSYSQLRGNEDDTSEWSPIVYNSDVGNPKSISYPYSTLDPSLTAIPWGLMAKFAFNDTFKLTDSDGKDIKLNQENIALDIDIYRFANTQNLSQQWRDLTDQNLMVWSRISVFSNFDKLYARIPTKLNSGQKYKISIENNF